MLAKSLATLGRLLRRFRAPIVVRSAIALSMLATSFVTLGRSLRRLRQHPEINAAC
jgi:hypothetical protein